MRKRHPAYVIFLILMALMALTGAALLIIGSAQHTELPRLWPGAGMMALRFP